MLNKNLTNMPLETDTKESRECQEVIKHRVEMIGVPAWLSVMVLALGTMVGATETEGCALL